MGDITQADREAFKGLAGLFGPHAERADAGEHDADWRMTILARHRQAAEKAQQEAVEEAYEEELRAANEHFREGIISYDVLKAAVNTAARMRNAAIRSQGHE